MGQRDWQNEREGGKLRKEVEGGRKRQNEET